MNESANRRLDSWKEIADYLDRDVRTVIRWEKTKSLPVHRVPGGLRQGVFAYTEEVDGWLNGLALEAGEDDAAPLQGHPEARNSRNGAGTSLAEPDAEPAGAIVPPASLYPASRIEPGAAPRGNHTRAVLLAFSLGVVLSLGGVWLASALRTHPAVRVTFSQDKLFAWDERGQLAWEYSFPQTLSAYYSLENARLVRFVDFEGNGAPALVVVVAYDQSRATAPRSAIYCFTPRGKLLWSYEPKFTFRFGDKEFQGPWLATDMVATPSGDNRQVWISFVHPTWWPGFVVRLDRKGGAQLQFVNAGRIQLLEYLRNRDGDYILAAGLNNEYQTAALAVLRADQSVAQSTQTTGSPFQCTSCEFGAPRAYFLFPPSELFRVRGESFHRVVSLNLRAGRFEVQTSEAHPRDGDTSYIPGVYEFDSDLRLVSASLGDAYWDLHRWLEKEGKIHHPVEQCPDRIEPRSVRQFTATNGWQQISAPASVARRQ